MNATKRCPRCKGLKAVEDFYRSSRDGRQSHCKPCQREYLTAYRQRPPAASLTDKQLERFWLNVAKTRGCWQWVGSQRGDYGSFYLNAHLESSHRVSWLVHHGPIPNGLHVLHKCDNPMCVRPSHLFLGTNTDNIADRMSKGRKSGPKKPLVGEDCPASQLTTALVLELRALGREGTPRTELSARYGIDISTVGQLLRGESWRHILDADALRYIAANERGEIPVAHPQGEAHHHSKLTATTVRQIRERASAGARAVDLADEFGVTDATISKIVKRQSWAHVM